MNRASFGALVAVSLIAFHASATSPEVPLTIVHVAPIGLAPGQTVKVALLQQGEPLRIREITGYTYFAVQLGAVFAEAQAPGTVVHVYCGPCYPEPKEGTKPTLSGRGARVLLTVSADGPQALVFPW